MVDYSKWDALVVSDDEDEEAAAAAAQRRQQPLVTRLDKPSTVTLTGGATPQLQVSPAESPQPTKSPAPPQPPLKVAQPPSLIENGAQEADFAWAQDVHTVTVHVPVPAGTRAAQVDVSLGARDGQLRVTVDGAAQLERELWADVWGAVVSGVTTLAPSQEEQEARELEWELCDWPGTDAQRRVCVTLYKHVPSDALRTLWWPRAFKGGSERDVAPPAAQRTTGGFQEAWDEAHKLFKAKIAAQKTSSSS